MVATKASASSAAPVGTASGAPAVPSPAATSAAASLPGKRGGKLVWALDLAPTVLIPYGLISFDIVQGHEFLYDSLLEWDKDLNVKPALAESFEATSDRTYVFHLRKGVKFHDGTEMTAEDVKYSMDTQVNPPLPGQKGFGLVIASTEIMDKYTVKITMPSANPTVPGFMARGNAPIIQKGAYEKSNPSNQAIGTGPYKLVEFVPNDRVVLTRNPDFWKPGLPYIDDITLKGFPDEQSRLAALRAGAIDGGNFTTDTVQAVKNDKSFALQKGLTSNPHLIHFTIKGDGKPWNDVRVRQAINKVVNRQDIIDKIYNGDAELTPVVASGFGDWPITKDDLANTYYKQDLAGAKKLMADAGFANGFPVTMQTHATQQDLRQAAEIIAEQVKAIGINVVDPAGRGRPVCQGLRRWLVRVGIERARRARGCQPVPERLLPRPRPVRRPVQGRLEERRTDQAVRRRLRDGGPGEAQADLSAHAADHRPGGAEPLHGQPLQVPTGAEPGEEHVCLVHQHESRPARSMDRGIAAGG